MTFKHWSLIPITCTLAMLVFLLSCNTSTPKSAANPMPDSTAIRLLNKEYTAQNDLDGAEMATVELLKILENNYSNKDKKATVVYQVICSYQPAVMPPGYEKRAPPSINKTDTAFFALKDQSWQRVKR